MALIMLFPVVGLAAPGTVQVGTDIWTPIGSSTNQFGGLFDGGSIDNAVNRAVIYASGGAVPGGSGTNRFGHAGGIFGMGTGTADAPVSISGCANYGTVTVSNCNQGGRAG